MFELSVYLKDRLVGRSRFTGDEVRIGRSADNEVQIDNLALSRYHASIENLGGALRARDRVRLVGQFDVDRMVDELMAQDVVPPAVVRGLG